MSNDPNDPNFDPYEIGEGTEYEENAFNTFNTDAYLSRRTRREDTTRSEPIPQPKRPRPAPPPFPQNPNAQAPQYPDPQGQPGVPGGDFANFNPDAYLQQRGQVRGGAVNPNEAAPLQGFESPIPTNTPSSSRAYSRTARARSLRSDYDILRDGEPVIRVGVILFFLIVGSLLSVCWIANITLLFWYARR
jgi:hypothetical protein